MNHKITVQDLIDFCSRNGLQPADAVLLLREPCANGDNMMHFLCNPQVFLGETALNLEDKHEPVPVAVGIDHLDTHFDEDS